MLLHWQTVALIRLDLHCVLICLRRLVNSDSKMMNIIRGQNSIETFRTLRLGKAEGLDELRFVAADPCTDLPAETRRERRLWLTKGLLPVTLQLLNLQFFTLRKQKILTCLRTFLTLDDPTGICFLSSPQAASFALLASAANSPSPLSP